MSTMKKLWVVVITFYSIVAAILFFLLVTKDSNSEAVGSTESVGEEIEIVVAQDAYNNWYYDDGKSGVVGTVSLIGDLDQDTMSICIRNIKNTRMIDDNDGLPKLESTFIQACELYDPFTHQYHRLETTARTVYK